MTGKRIATAEEISALIQESEKEDIKVTYSLDDLRKFEPMTDNQALLEEYYRSGFSLMCDGVAGVGKTFCVMNLAFEEVLDENTPYDKIIIVRTAVATRDIGFLPGDENQKLEVLEKPYYGICDELFGNKSKNNYKALKNSNYIEFMSSSFIRGITIKNAIVIVDECQNFNYHELKSTITRLGYDTKIFFCGDYFQSDLIKSRNDKTGITKFKRILKKMPSFQNVTFNKEDIVRSGIVAEFYLAEIDVEDEDFQNEQGKDDIKL